MTPPKLSEIRKRLSEALDGNERTVKHFVAHAPDDIAHLLATVEKLKAELKSLAGESSGMLSAHEYVIRPDAGNTNWECYQLAVERARQALREIEE